MNYPLFAVDLTAIGALAFALYYPRHRRKDLAVALLGVNIGVFAVTTALSTATVGAGLGLGLFGVLSIIRLRSTELSQVEVAYYFTSPPSPSGSSAASDRECRSRRRPL